MGLKHNPDTTCYDDTCFSSCRSPQKQAARIFYGSIGLIGEQRNPGPSFTFIASVVVATPKEGEGDACIHLRRLGNHSMLLLIQKIISGGQTGVDRAALDFALNKNIPCGGWCPKGRVAEDGPISPRYPLQETPSARYFQRTTWNVRDSSGTLLFSPGPPTLGTAYTLAVAQRLGKPYLVMDCANPLDSSILQAWVQTHQISILNVAGPRESRHPGIYLQASTFLNSLF